MDDVSMIRQQKRKLIEKMGVSAYPATTKRTKTIQEILDAFDASIRQDMTSAGRLVALREHGKTLFGTMEDSTGAIQILLKKDVCDNGIFTLFQQTVDIGDIIEVQGSAFLTKTKEKTILVNTWNILTKSLRQLPSKWHGLKDEELRARKRYLDLIANKQSKNLFRKRSAFIQEIRSFLCREGYIEVETPILEHVPGGADAEPFVTRHNALDLDLYLRISLELHLKRLIIGGMDKVFEIGKVFRNEGVSTQHLQEFTMLEFYWAYADYNAMMEFIEKLYTETIEKTFGTLEFPWGKKKIDFRTPWPRIDYYDVFKKKTGIALADRPSKEKLVEEAAQIGIRVDPNVGRGRIIDHIYKKLVRPTMEQPTFLLNHPIDLSPLTKQLPTDPTRVERFQVVIHGVESANAYSELNDPMEQRARFEGQMQLRDAGDKEAQRLDEDFLEALEYGMPPTAGAGIGIDRLLMFLLNSQSIRNVVLFPTLRPVQHQKPYD